MRIFRHCDVHDSKRHVTLPLDLFTGLQDDDAAGMLTLRFVVIDDSAPADRPWL
jgi:hypothetical protein